MYSLLELYPDLDSESDTINSGDSRGLCDREDDRRGDLCLTTLLSVMSKLSITSVFEK